MRAAVMTGTGAPRCAEVPEPTPGRPGEELVEVLAVGIHHVTRGHATGLHYSTEGPPPVAGVDGVGRTADGTLKYFVQGPGMPGTLAARTVVDTRRSVTLAADADPVAVAGTMNPAMASWLALRCRVPFTAGQDVLVLGATGASGTAAVQVARHLGARTVVAVGRDRERLAALPALGATRTVPLEEATRPGQVPEVDVVLDLLWGTPATDVLAALLRSAAQRERGLRWVHLGSMAGETAPVPGALLRAARVELVGSGFGSVSAADIVRELPGLADHVTRGTIRLETETVPLEDVAEAWSRAARSRTRVVVTP